MDCRRSLGLGFCLLVGAAGCTRHDAALPIVPPAQASKAPAPAATPVEVVPPGAVVHKAADLPKRPPSAATCVAFGDFAGREAEAPDLSETARQAKREQARVAFEQALTIDPHCLQAYLSLGQLYIDMKDHAHAEATYRKACQMFPNEAAAFFEMGRCYGGEKRWDEAIKALARAAQLAPENRRYVDTLGWMQARAGRFDESLASFRKVYDEPEAQWRLALMLDHLDQKELCRQHLQAALNQDPKMDRARAMLAELDRRPAAPLGGPDKGPAAVMQQTSFSESAKPPAPPKAADAPPAWVASASQSPSAPGKPVLLPPPPHIPIRYEATPAAPDAGPVVPPVPGPNS